MQDNARYAFQVLSRDIRMAGYFGCAGSDIVPVNTLNTPADFLYSFGNAVQGYEASAPVIITTSLAGTDSVVIRGVEGGGFKVTAHPATLPPAAGSAALRVTPASGLAAGDIVLVSDCLAAAIFQITSISPSFPFDAVAHITPSAGPGNVTQVLGKEYVGGEIMKISTRVYYISNAAGRPALYRRAGAAAAEEVVEGVENMQIEYGEDSNADLTADVYRKADAVADWSKVVSARVSLLMQTVDNNVASQPQPYTYNGATTTPAATDRRLRQVYSTVIALRNRAP
jgi:type IV pilus assembly protein PilW